MQIDEKFNNLRVDEMVAQNVIDEIAATTMSDIYFGRSFEGVNASDPAASTSFYKCMMFVGPCFLVTHEDGLNGLNGLTSAAKETVDERATNHVCAAIRTTARTMADENDENRVL